MSIENVKKFYVSASEDAKLVEALKKISEEMQQKSLASDKLNELVSSKIIPLAKERGFDFTADELIAYSQEMIKGLSEEDLAAVSGGMSPRTAAIALAFTLGSSFVAAGVVNMMSNTPTQNQAIMSSSDSAKTANKDTVPKVVKDKTTKVDVDRNTANENQNLSKDRDIQEKLRDKEIVLPGEQAKTTENKSNVEENGKLLETADIENKKDDEINEAKNQNNLAVAESNPVAVNNQIINARGLNNEEEIEGNDQVRPMGQNVNDQNVNNQNGMGQNVNDQNANNQNVNDQRRQEALWLEFLNANNQMRPNANNNVNDQNANNPNANNQNVNDQNVNDQNVNDQNGMGQNVNDQNVNNQNVNDQNGMGQNVNDQNANNQNANNQNVNDQNANNQNVNDPVGQDDNNKNKANEDNEEEDTDESPVALLAYLNAINNAINNANNVIENTEEEDTEEEDTEENDDNNKNKANEDNEEEEIIDANNVIEDNNEEEIMTANNTTTKEALKEHVNDIKSSIEDGIRAAFNETVIDNGKRSMSVEDATTFAKNITDSVSEEVFKDIVITRKGNIITLSATGEVPGMFWGTNSHTEKATINVDEFVKNLNEESIKNEVKTEIGVIKEAIKTNFREKVRSRSVEYTNADLPIVIENLAEYVEEIENTNDSVVKSVSEDKKLVTVVSEIDGTVKESIDLEKFVNELNTQAREKRMQGIRNLAEDCPGSLKKNMLREKSKQWIDNCILYEIETKICENYEQNATEEVENISEVPEGDQRRIALNLAANIEGNFGGILKDIEENEDNYVIKAQYIAGTTKCFVTIAAKDRSGKIIEHTEEIDMKKEIQNRLSSYKLNYDMFFNGTATEQAEYLLETLSKIETLDEIENVKDIKDNLTDLANQIVIKAENYKKGEHLKKGVLDKNIDYKSAGLFTSLKGDTKAIGKDDNVVVTENAPLVLSGNWKYGEGVGSEGLHKILSFYEQSLNY